VETRGLSGETFVETQRQLPQSRLVRHGPIRDDVYTTVCTVNRYTTTIAYPLLLYLTAALPPRSPSDRSYPPPPTGLFSSTLAQDAGLEITEEIPRV
jgi:hypothetical protein